MRKRLLCVLAAAVLLLGILTGCGARPSDNSDSGNPGVGSTEPDNPNAGGHTDDDPVAVMNERVKAVNDAVNWEYIGVEEKVEAGLLFYSLTSSSSSDRSETRDYNPDKPLDYYVWYRMVKLHTEGIVSEDTYAALLKDARPWNVPIKAFSGEDVIETDEFYVYYEPDALPGDRNRGRCFMLAKDTDILYCFSVEEQWYMANYYGNGYYNFPNSGGASVPEENALNLSYTGDDVEYIFTPEFWKAFAQTAKFVGKADDDFKDDEFINDTISTIGARNGYRIVEIEDDDEDKGGKYEEKVEVKVPYIEEWYAGGSYGRSTIREGFEEFLQNSGGEYGSLVIDDFGQGEPTMFFNNGLYKYAGGGEVTLIHDFSEDIDEYRAMATDADRTHLLFSGWPHHEILTVIDLKTFKVMDSVYIIYGVDDDGIFEFSDAAVNGVTVDEDTAVAACDKWYSACDVLLLDKMYVYNVDFDTAWREYENRG